MLDAYVLCYVLFILYDGMSFYHGEQSTYMDEISQ